MPAYQKCPPVAKVCAWLAQREVSSSATPQTLCSGCSASSPCAFSCLTSAKQLLFKRISWNVVSREHRSDSVAPICTTILA